MSTAPGDLSVLEAINQHRVNEGQPATSNASGLDYERCSALHNAIVRHGWAASGHEETTIPTTTWWTTPQVVPYHQVLQQRLHATLVDFLKRALLPTDGFPDDPQEYNFFYFLPSMQLPPEMFTGDQLGLGSLVTLYVTRPEFKAKLLDGIIYDQAMHRCLFYEPEYDLASDIQYGKPLPWQPLETILSVYIDMIERRKVVALHKSVCEPPMQFAVPQPDGSIKIIGMPAPEGSVQHDPVTGLRRSGEVFNPWKMQPFTQRDVEETLTAWNMLVEHIERKMSLSAVSAPELGLYTEDVLRQIGVSEDRFAWKFLAQARKPRCTYLGPGLRLLTTEELLNQPFQNVVDDDYSFNPIQILTAEQQARNQWHSWADVPNLPSGLYLDACNPDGLFPFEDGCRLILPYTLGGNGYATTSDGRAIQRNCDLYQLGRANPFMPNHATPLVAVLGHFRAYVKTGMWEVGDAGVKEGIERFREADTAMAEWQDNDDVVYPGYVCGFGAGGRWW